ncbi:hypothetical protein CCYA_CCYA03G1006 [Cyanidiococcus yangmingshanensis]|nr:hypothetical protein CCYA_CCYA03G1006 [Cyanidiococcus yangmingshanensis]
MEVQVNTSIEILAPASVIWDILIDFDRYPEWNHLFVSVKGTPQLGATLTVQMSRNMRFRPKVIQLLQENELTWEGKLGLGWFFRGKHSFRIEPTANGCLFTHTERFTGLVAVVFPRGRYRRRLTENFERFNQALKGRAEQAAQ